MGNTISIEHVKYKEAIRKERQGMMACLHYILAEMNDSNLQGAALHLRIAIAEIEDAPIRKKLSSAAK